MATFIPRPREVTRPQEEVTALPKTRRAFPARSNAAQILTSDYAVRQGVAATKAGQNVERRTDSSFRTRKHDPTGDANSRLPISSTSHIVSPAAAVSQNFSPTTPKVLRRKRSLIGDHVRKNRETPMHSGPGSLSIRIPQHHSAARSNNAQRQEVPSSRGLAMPVVPPTQDHRPRGILEEPRSIYYATTPLSELSATPSLRDDSPSIFSQVSPSSTNTPATSVTSYSPQVIQTPHFGPGHSTSSASAKSLAISHHTISHVAHQAFIPTDLSETRSQHERPLANSSTVKPAAAMPARIPLSTAKTSRQPKGSVVQKQPIATTQREERAKLVRPPELAHLETAYTTPVAGEPPERPSRHGVESLTAIRAHKTPKVATSLVNTNPLNAGPADTDGFRQLSRSQPTHSLAQTRLSIKPPERPRMIDITLPTASGKPHPRSATTPASAASGKSTSRFGFFHRRDKTPAADSDVEDSMQVKKGPIAGTGHEGYGRHASKRRSSGGTSSKRPSSGSTFSRSDDDFLARKAAPVFLRKGSDGQIVPSDRTSSGFEGSRTSQMSSDWSYEASRSSLQQSKPAARTQSPLPSEGAIPVAREMTTRGSGSRGRGGTMSGINIRSRNASKDSKRGPTPENHVHNLAGSRQLTPFAEPLPGFGSSIALAGKAKTSALRSFFGFGSSKTKPSSKSSKISAPLSMTSTEAAVHRSSVLPSSMGPGKTMAHYEMIESTDDVAHHHSQVAMEDIGDILEEAVLTDAETHSGSQEAIKFASHVAAPVDPTSTKSVESAEDSFTLPPELQRQHSRRPHHTAAMPIVLPSMSGPVPSQEDRYKGQSRLPQVAKHTRNAANQRSFSRPFDAARSEADGASAEPPLPLPMGHTRSRSHKKRSSSNNSTMSSHDRSKVHTDHLVRDVHTKDPHDVASPPPDFFKMPARKYSDVSVSDSSNSTLLRIAAGTAAIPGPGAPISPDEVWQEYDDLIDKVLTPSESQTSPSSSKTAKDPDYFSERKHSGPKTDDLKSKTSTAFPQLGQMAASFGTKLSPFAGVEKRFPEFRGAQHPVLRTQQPPAGPLPEPPGSVLQSSNASQLIRRASVKTKKQTGDQSMDHTSKVDLRKAALEVSRWMSFDQVLVSPAHGELQTAHDERVLVVDGLGKEWSLFCAKNYPNAQVFGLSPAPWEPEPSKLTSPLPNYRHLRHSNLAVSFHFPANYFHTVVFRFPAATSEFGLERAISECKRVLRPGGYLEICVIDLDLTVMGPKTRRAVKGLKENLQQSHPEVSLKPTSDYVQYLLGRYGLEKLNRVMIGIPVAGSISSSPNRSRDEGAVMKAGHVSKNSDARRYDMFRALAPRVARWWYTQTHEQKMLASNKDSKSIWDDQGLLKECKDKQAAFRLLICHAQKPVLNKRKTQSL